MSMAEQDKAMKELDALFHTARTHQPEMSEGLMAAILDDAARVQDLHPAAPVFEFRPEQNNVFTRLFATLGGGFGLGGLVCAGMVGVWIGLAPPSFIPDPVDLATSQISASDPFDGFDMTELMNEDLQ